MSDFLDRLHARLARASAHIGYYVRRRFERESLEQELRFHADMEVRERILRGESPDTAALAARRRLGSPLRIREAAEEAWVAPIFHGLWQDIRHAARSARRRPVFSIALVTTLAIGIAAPTTIHRIASYVLLAPAPGVREADELATARFYLPPSEGPRLTVAISHPAYLMLRQATTLQGLAAYRSQDVHLAQPNGGTASRQGAEFITDDYLRVLGLSPRRGRAFGPGDFSADAPLAAMISDRIWRTELGGDPEVIGSTVLVNGRPVTVVGVMPSGFRGAHFPRDADLWFPTTAGVRLLPHDSPRTLTSPRGMLYSSLVARMNAGVSVPAVQRELELLARRADAAYPKEPPFASLKLSIGVEAGLGLRGDSKAQLAQLMWLMSILGLLVMAVAAANAANLLCVRSASRRRELLVRVAIGAGRFRLARHAFVETTLYAMLGISLAIGVAALVPAFMEETRLRSNLPAISEIPIGWQSYSVAVGIGLLVAVVAGALNVRTIRQETSGDRVVGPDRRAARAYVALGVVQVAASVALIVAAGLTARTVYNLRHEPLGLSPAGILVARVSPQSQGYSYERGRAYMRTLESRLRQEPGVRAAGLVVTSPFGEAIMSLRVWPQDGDSTKPHRVTMQLANRGAFDVLGLRLVRGRLTAEDEPETNPTPVVVNESFERAILSGRSAIGQSIRARGRDPMIVIGVVADARLVNPADPPVPMLFGPVSDSYGAVMVRVDQASLGRTATRVREIARELDPTLPIYGLRSMEEQIAAKYSAKMMLAGLATVLGALVLLLAAVGLYGVTAFAVTQRYREFGLRIALGASRRAIARLSLRGALLVMAIGGTIGLGGAVLLSRYLSAQLYGVSPTDVTTFAFAALFTATILGIGVAVPALRAMTADPMLALRAEG